MKRVRISEKAHPPLSPPSQGRGRTFPIPLACEGPRNGHPFPRSTRRQTTTPSGERGSHRKRGGLPPPSPALPRTRVASGQAGRRSSVRNSGMDCPQLNANGKGSLEGARPTGRVAPSRALPRFPAVSGQQWLSDALDEAIHKKGPSANGTQMNANGKGSLEGARPAGPFAPSRALPRTRITAEKEGTSDADFHLSSFILHLPYCASGWFSGAASANAGIERQASSMRAIVG